MTDSFDVLDVSAAPAIAELCARSLGDAPDDRAIELTLFGAGHQPPVVRGDPETGVVASVGRRGQSFIRLLVVDPAARGRGLGRALLDAAESDLGREQAIRIGTDAPDYLFPGVDVAEIEMLCLAERAGYRRVDANYNMVVDLAQLPEEEHGRAIDATAADRDELAEWLPTRWPAWADEVLTALDQGTLVIGRDDRGISGFCAWDVNRRGWLGPIAVRPTRRDSGIGTPLLIAALHRMRAAGLTRAEIAWVGPMGFYARRVGARVSRVYAVWEKPPADPAVREKPPADPAVREKPPATADA